jgi:hypothetical protein
MRIRIYNIAHGGRKGLCTITTLVRWRRQYRHCLFSVPSVRAEGTGEVYNRKGAALLPKLCRHIQGSCWDSFNFYSISLLSTPQRTFLSFQRSLESGV